MGQKQIETDSIAFDRLFDWLLGGLVVLGGLATSIAGIVGYSQIDRSEMSEVVRDADLQLEGLTEAEVIDAAVTLGQWGSLGLAAAGALFTLFGVAVVVVHGRARKNGTKTPRWVLGIAGATAATVLGFVPFSTALGGATAGYLDPDERASGAVTGAIAGLFSALPLLVVALFVAVGLFTGLAGEVVGAVAVVLATALFAVLVYTVGFGALGGFLGGWLR
ncbi:putative membrane protein [Halapricum desulfuricans]|uniref:Putative membrane protein n=1 Tax=Halapricum desulfuricans TaxID=2841257 RepID=A0A897NJI0_9EURY|nr:DUF5518 domain-containing protein [Halapricum desulfuricans]QSG12471.1 putative membrane protein [Halapricum desulfuricans]